MENPTPSAHAILDRLLRALDVPDCGCPLYDRCPECGARDDCAEHCAACDTEWPVDAAGAPAGRCGRCGLPGTVLAVRIGAHSRRTPKPLHIRRACPHAKRARKTRPACVHVRARDHDTPEQEWQGLLWLHGFAEYGEPDPAVFPTGCMPGSGGKIDVLTARLERGIALWHDEDGAPGRLAAEREVLVVSRRDNGSIERHGLRLQAGEDVRHAG